MERITLSTIILFTFIASFGVCDRFESKYHCPKSQVIQPCNCTKASDDGLDVVCASVNLASLSLPLLNIAAQNLPIDELRLENCNLVKLSGLLLRDLEVRKLFIVDTPLEHIDDEFFLGANETLQEIEIENSRFTAFPRAFGVLGKLVKLKLNRHNITTLEVSALANTAASQRIERLHISNGNISDVAVEFVQSLRKLKTLDMHGNRLTTLKRNQFKNLRDLEVLDISHNNITKLDSSHIADLTKLSWCNVSHNALTEITRGTFARSSVLRVLNMAHNNIKRLDANSFRGMRFLRRLYLSDNRITDVGRGSFSSITRIGTIDLARNQLKKVDYQMFAQLNYIEIIDLAENNITEVQKQAFKDMYLTHINMSHNAIEKFENNAFENCVNMTMLDLSHNRIVDFPKFTFDDLSYATEWQLSYNGLTNLSSVPLHNMTGIKVLNVSHNQIVDIPRNTFPKLYELHTIDMSHNKLTTISNGVFQTLFSLRSLNFSFNALNSIKTQVFGTLPTLLEMDLTNNDLREIARSALIKLSSLRTLNLENNHIERLFTVPLSLNALHLRNNSITEIAERTWPTMNALLELDLSENSIGDNLRGDSFSGLQSIRMLKLRRNRITKVPKESVSTLPTLQYLHLEDNEISQLETSAFGRMPVVFEVHLENNRIRNVSSRAFDGLLQLLKLSLSNNSIRSIPTDAFSGLVSLRQLDLSHNFLKKLDNKTNSVLDDCLSLETIDLSHNKFNFITKKTFPSNQWVPYRLREIDLSFNEIPVLTYDFAFGTQKVTKMNVSHNQIIEIRRNVISNWTRLETLDLSYNQLRSLTNDDFNLTLPENVTVFLASHNQLADFPIEIFSNLSIVHEVDLSNNQIEQFDIELQRNTRRGLDLNIAENPVKCDCHIRPLKHIMDAMVTLPEHFERIVCSTPQHLNGKSLVDISDDNLNCPTMSENEELSVAPHLVFRDIFFFKGNLTVRWILNNSKKDIGGFYVTIRDQDGVTSVEHHISYESRIDQIYGHEICRDGTKCGNLELCVLSKDSRGTISGWFDSQCVRLPNNFSTIRKRYAMYNEQVFYIQSLVKKIRAPTVSLFEEVGVSSSQRVRMSESVVGVVTVMLVALNVIKF